MFSTSIMQKGRRQREESAKTRHGTGGNDRGGGVKTGSWKPGMENQREGLALQREVLGEGGADPSVLMTVGLIKSQSCQTFYKSSFFCYRKYGTFTHSGVVGGDVRNLLTPTSASGWKQTSPRLELNVCWGLVPHFWDIRPSEPHTLACSPAWGQPMNPNQCGHQRMWYRTDDWPCAVDFSGIKREPEFKVSMF